MTRRGVSTNVPLDHLDRRIGAAEGSREVVALQLRRREVFVEVRDQAGPGGERTTLNHGKLKSLM